MPKPSEDVKEAFRGLVPAAPGVTVRPMFGHLAAFIHGNMFSGVFSEKLFVRAAGADRDRLLAAGGEDFAPMPGRRMNGYVCLPDEWRSDEKSTRAWIDLALETTLAMPPKQPKEPKRGALTLPSDTEITMSRVFDVRRALVFRAYTDPELIPRWWGPREMTTVVDQMDARQGGTWRFISHGPDGSEFAFNGVYREVMPPERIVNTFEFEPLPGHVSVETVVFEELPDGRTRAKMHVQFDNVEDRDGMVSSGMETGWTESMERLTELLATL